MACPRADWLPPTVSASTLIGLTWDFELERVTGIEPAFSAWEADVLPLNYTRGPGDHSQPAEPASMAAADGGTDLTH